MLNFHHLRLMIFPPPLKIGMMIQTPPKIHILMWTNPKMLIFLWTGDPKSKLLF